MFKRRHLIVLMPYITALLPFLISALSTLPFYETISTSLFFALLAITLVGSFVLTRAQEQDVLANRLYFAVVVSMLLVLVQNTGWFYSPLLFVLYLATVAFCLLYSFFSGGLFLIAISVLFVSYIDRTTPMYDFIRMAAFFTALPLSIAFSREFLRLKESEKQILILKDEREQFKGEVERLQKNKLVWNDVLLRQSLATARNFALYWDSNSAGLPPKLQRDLKRMSHKLEEALQEIKQFEHKTLDDTYL